MTKPSEKELIKRSWKKIPSFYKNNKFMKQVVDYIIENEMDSNLYASTSLQILNVSSERINPKFVFRIESSGGNVRFDYFCNNKMIYTKELSETEAFEIIESELNQMLK